MSFTFNVFSKRESDKIFKKRMTQTLYIIAFLAISFASAFSVFWVAACDLTPMMPPPHERSIALAFSLYCWRIAVTSWLNS